MRCLLKFVGFILVTVVAVVVCFFLLYKFSPAWWERFFYPLEYESQISTTSSKYKLDPYLVAALVYEESKFNPHSKSKAGALGLMQVMPETGRWAAKNLGMTSYSNDYLYDPGKNIEIGCWYLSYLMGKYKDEKLSLAAYNGGDANVDKWLKEKDNLSADEILKDIPFAETKVFVKRVTKTKQKYIELYPDSFRK